MPDFLRSIRVSSESPVVAVAPGRMAQEVDRLFETIIHAGWHRPDAATVQAPRMDLWDRGDAYVAEIEAPGITRDDVTVTSEGRAVVVATHPVPGPRGSSSGLLVGERHRRAIRRRIPIPRDGDAAHVQVRCENGLLKVRIPKNRRSFLRAVTV